MPIFYTDIVSLADSVKAVVFKDHFVSHRHSPTPHSHLRRHLAMSGVIFDCHNLEGMLLAFGGYRQGGCQHPTMHRTVPTTKNELIQNVNSAKVEKA